MLHLIVVSVNGRFGIKDIRVKFKTLDCKDLTFMLHSKKAYFLNIQSTNLLISYAV